MCEQLDEVYSAGINVPPRRARMFWMPRSFALYNADVSVYLLRSSGGRTCNAASIDPFSMFVHVKCITVSISYSC